MFHINLSFRLRSPLVMSIFIALGGITQIWSQPAPSYNASLDQLLFGHLTQTEVGDPDTHFMCGPVSTVNSFGYLQKQFPKVYGNNLIPSTPAETAKDLATLMGTTPDGTAFSKLIAAKEKWFGDHPGTVKTVVEGRSIEGTTPSMKLTWRWLFDQIKHGEDVEMLLSQEKGDGTHEDHYVTLTEFKWIDTDKDDAIDKDEDGSLGFIDPADGKWHSIAMYEEQSKIFLETYKIDETDSSSVFIWGAVKESPKTAPDSMQISFGLFIGIAMLVGFRHGGGNSSSRLRLEHPRQST